MVADWKGYCLETKFCDVRIPQTVMLTGDNVSVRGHSEICFSAQIRAICDWYANCLHSASRVNSSPEPYLYFTFVYQNFFFLTSTQLLSELLQTLDLWVLMNGT